MGKVNFKKAIAGILAVATLSSVCFGCANTEAASSGSASGAASKAATTAKTKVTFWYLWSGDTVATINNMVKDYNSKSDKYEVTALSVPDSQKITAAISAGNGPDVTDDFSSNVGKMAAAGIMEPLDDYISKTKYDVDDFIPAALDSCKLNGKTYALPVNINLSALYYNKTLLKAAGYTNPPKTMEEMYEMAVKGTKVNSDGTIKTLGFPDFPNVYYLSAFTAAAGGGWYTSDGKAAAADNEGNKTALDLIRNYRQKFGVANIQKFSSGGKYLDPTDPFLMGNQLFRIDGPWMGKNIKETFKVNVDYGVTYVPYPAAHPEFEGRSFASSSILFVTGNSKNKEGAFDFTAYVCGKQGQIDFTIKGGDFPARKSLLDNADFKKSYDSDFYAKMAENKNLTGLPNNAKSGEYNTYCNEQTELCMNLKQDVATTLKNINKKGTELLK